VSDSGIQAWQLSLIVTLLIVAVEPLVHLLLSRRPNLAVSRWFRTATLSVLVVLTVVVAVAALGPDLADKLSSVAAGVVALVAFVLALRSYQSQSAPPSGTGPSALAPPAGPSALAPPAGPPALDPPTGSAALDPPTGPVALDRPDAGPSDASLPRPDDATPPPKGAVPPSSQPDQVTPPTNGSPPRATGRRPPRGGAADREPFLPQLIGRLLGGRKTPRR
jgi:hypothetical protein